MQKLDLGVDYRPEADSRSTTEPLTAEPVVSRSAVPASRTVPPESSRAASVNGTAPVRTSQTMRKKSAPFPILIAIVAILAGSATGVGAFKLQSKSDPLLSGEPIQQVAGDTVKNGDVFGSAEEANFKDSAEGFLEIGGFEGEGSHKLLRPGGDTQTVYLVSTVTELDKFDGMNVKVWGETYKGQKVGWLMDVGRIQVINTEGQPPSED